MEWRLPKDCMKRILLQDSWLINYCKMEKRRFPIFIVPICSLNLIKYGKHKNNFILKYLLMNFIKNCRGKAKEQLLPFFGQNTILILLRTKQKREMRKSYRLI